MLTAEALAAHNAGAAIADDGEAALRALLDQVRASPRQYSCCLRASHASTLPACDALRLVLPCVCACRPRPRRARCVRTKKKRRRRAWRVAST